MIHRTTLLLLSALVVAGAVGVRPSEARAQQLVALVHPANDVTEVSARDLTRIYKLSKQRWPNGQPISIYLPPASSEVAQLLALRVLNLGGEADIFAFYLRAIFRQKIADVPETLPGVEAAVRRIASDPGGIALVPREQLPPNGAVRALPIEGF